MNTNASDTREIMRLVTGCEPGDDDVARVAAICHVAEVPRGDPMRAVVVAIYAINIDASRQIRDVSLQAQTAVTVALVAAALAAGAAIVFLGLAILR